MSPKAWGWKCVPHRSCSDPSTKKLKNSAEAFHGVAVDLARPAEYPRIHRGQGAMNSYAGKLPARQEDGTPVSARIRTVVVNELGVRRANGVTWLDSLLKAKEIGTPQ